MFARGQFHARHARRSAQSVSRTPASARCCRSGPIPAHCRSRCAPIRRRAALAARSLLTAGRGIAAPNAGPGTPELKASAYGVTTEEEARRAVREQTAQQGRLHQDLGRRQERHGARSSSPALYRAIIDEAHKQRTRVIAHVFYLDDAKDLARAGVDGFAHLVRDREADDELVALIKSRNIFVMPNLAISENGAHASPPAWLADPLLRETSPAEVIDRVRRDRSRGGRPRPSHAAQRDLCGDAAHAGEVERRRRDDRARHRRRRRARSLLRATRRTASCG